MIAKKGLPALQRRPCSFRHIFCHGGLADIDTKLEQLTMDPRRTPQWIGDAHLTKKGTNFGRKLVADRHAIVISSASRLGNQRDAIEQPCRA